LVLVKTLVLPPMAPYMLLLVFLVRYKFTRAQSQTRTVVILFIR
jgi:hypothetical protein